ncbi:AAA family ATPase [Enterococcus sp. BWB1-3]|uniref:AAA family ATPase n=1 Tax=unclassified Enterococcus TaxID=2608891 RepID=UPI001922FDA4|nr:MULTISPECIES: AAA family ATPase [unclassified Enterococcus]MBL1228689.1 AAA family ATPase [Enterococcus sp. BWB1-3]MCB5952761.1 AAA family ATPase [Enterococcus sp. BWT-B8]
MKLNFNKTNVFSSNEIVFDKKVNFVFGKNGTGKSTITYLVKEQFENNLDIHTFQGFDSIIGEDNRLNAVILGEENTSINQQITAKEYEKETISLEIEKMSKEINEPEDKSKENTYSKLEKSKKEKVDKERTIETFYTNSATMISKNSQLVENARTYRKNSFKKEIGISKFLEKDELEKNRKILGSNKKTAKAISFPAINFSKYQESVNEILLAKVESKIVLRELDNNSKKTNFAQSGMHIHKPGEECSFCGNLITSERMDLLKRYFSADEVELLKKRISNGRDKIDVLKKSLLSMTIKSEDFYPDFFEKAESIREDAKSLVESQVSFLDDLVIALNEKDKNLFKEDEALSLAIPKTFDDIASEYNSLIKLNNEFADNLELKQKEAMQALRLHEVNRIVDEYKLDSELVRLEELIKKQEEAQNDFDDEVSKIKIEKKKIDSINDDITRLKKKTKNTEKLANNINDRLRYLVSFELVRKKVENQEFYEIQDPYGETRPITELSTGEKNIIAFLYFIEKLEEVPDTPRDADRVIIFDDPMTSNDDTMQYLIIDELQKIIKKCDKKSNSDKFILLTHNIFFYLNCSFDIKNRRDGKNAFEENNFYKLQRCNTQTKISKIENKQQDFKTNYEALWHELVFLYTEDKPEMMLNPIRRIIETFIIFNGKEDFYKDNKDAKNLFNTNSHYFPDLEADLNGKSPEDIKTMMKKCFKDNGAENHFTKHWKNTSKT